MAAPLRVGFLDDLADGPPSPTDVEQWLRLVADEYLAAGRLDREVEVVASFGLGLPSGTAAAVEHAFARLDAADVLLVVGPAVGDNALVATPLAERFQLPTINWAGTERARGAWMFHLQVGSHEDEGAVLAQHLASLGASRVGVVHDRSPIGRRYLHYLTTETELYGAVVTATAGLTPLAEDATAQVGRVLASGPDALVYLGLGRTAAPVARAADAAGFDGPRLMNSAGMFGRQPEIGRALEGWTYVDIYSDANPALAALRERLEVPPARAAAAAKGYDLARLAVEGLARASELTRDGVRDGLEQIKWLPATEGHDGTQLGFGHRDRGALHGRYLVLRRWQDGESVQV
ncbi:ABC transporter substrate-binding protein [Frankia sp. AgB1.9]|uniref:ABC transporter substrate-binding protein n=1 Tax=unclassified Frankia TaxID=2632575 RepID=UPI001933ABA8|nr:MULTISPECIES: ABC transporter substrate-binding protein [unclassified Frankia]MBL7488202.1 ABC transporter substrate-binding protein [Frankia sp. AgW1.1]MBL7548155.1 ABC transporter substrate-binding protein [Frankia sp. AgB1.9]MBL7620381.1 ABC transporter substrate-binding protein [Frankia sp. AgB1.8]